MTKSDIAVGLLKGSLLLYGWLIICGIWKLITLALHIEFKWIIATCVWVAVYGTWCQITKSIRRKNDTSYVPHTCVDTGDIVRANKFSTEYGLTPGKEYEILKHYGERYAVQNDAGVDVICTYRCFTR